MNRHDQGRGAPPEHQAEPGADAEIEVAERGRVGADRQESRKTEIAQPGVADHEIKGCAQYPEQKRIDEQGRHERDVQERRQQQHQDDQRGADRGPRPKRGPGSRGAPMPGRRRSAGQRKPI